MSNAYFVYVLRSEDTNRRYVGSCRDVDDRLLRHNTGQSKSTKHGVPRKLIHWERFGTRAEAVQKERYYKTGRGRDELDKIEFSEIHLESIRGVAQPG